jgi:hypothetical protein
MWKGMTMTVQPQLAAPGQGLPPVERFFANLMVQWQKQRVSRAEASAAFAGERDNMLKLVETLTPVQRSTQVLIKRLPGLEDSSRFWSVYMVLEHLTMVNLGILDIIKDLSQGNSPTQKVLTEAVKPHATTDETVIKNFADACITYEKAIALLGNLNSEMKWPHPWFGPFSAADWHFMMGFHMNLHRRQVEAIIRGLS